MFYGSCGGCFNKVTDTMQDVTNQVTQVLDQGISALNAQSANWQEILNNTLRDLPSETSNIIRGDISNLLQRTVAATGSEARCDADFFRIRVQQGLQYIKNKLLKRPSPPPEPHFCNPVPSAIDMSLHPNQRNKIDFFGYDFDMTKKVDVFLESASTEVNVSQYLERSTPYLMTLNLGSNGVRLTKNSQRIILKWNNQTISTISVIQPSPEICETKYHEEPQDPITYTPPKTNNSADAEFYGHGPHITCTVKLEIKNSNSVVARIYMNAIEVDGEGKITGDHTQATGSHDYTVYKADPDETIERIVSSDQAYKEYTDSNNHSDDQGSDGCVSKFLFVGDTEGKEAGTKTHVSVTLKPIRMQLKEKGDCVSTETLKTLNLQNKISPALLKEMQKKNVTSQQKK
jgi:hypothetical protein